MSETKQNPTHSLPVGRFACIVADPPWPDQGRLESKWGGKVGTVASVPVPYHTMTIAEISGLGVREVAADDSHLYLWVVNRYIRNAYEVAEAWGFKPTALLTWCKKPMGMGLGGTFVQATEHLLFARRGSLEAKQRIDRTWFEWTRTRHSVKPEASYGLIESVSPGPYLELFARRKRDGWTVWGDEV